MPEKPILQGDLSRIQLPDVLSFMAMIRETGKLVIMHDDLERSIHWKDGEIVFANSNSPEHSLGMFLLRNGKITQEQYEESKRRVTPQLRHGKLLVQMGAISPKDLWWGVKNQNLEIDRRAGAGAHRPADQHFQRDHGRNPPSRRVGADPREDPEPRHHLRQGAR
jgi:hypothetical protein